MDYTARVTGNNVAVRESANSSSRQLTTLSLGVNVDILETVSSSSSGCSSKTWYKIQYYGNKTGYMCKDYVSKKSENVWLFQVRIVEYYYIYSSEKRKETGGTRLVPSWNTKGKYKTIQDLHIQLDSFFDYLKEYCEVVYLERTKGVSSTELRNQKNNILWHNNYMKFECQSL